MIAVFDASAAVKLVIREPGTAVSERLWDDDANVITAPTIVVPEVASAIEVAAQSGRLAVDEHAARRSWFERVAGTEMRSVDPGLALRAAAVTRRGVRGCDAVYVAYALELAAIVDEPVALVSFDRSQRAAVAPEDGVALVPATV